MSARGDMTVETLGMSRSLSSVPSDPAVGVRAGRMGRGIAVPGRGREGGREGGREEEGEGGRRGKVFSSIHRSSFAHTNMVLCIQSHFHTQM